MPGSVVQQSTVAGPKELMDLVPQHNLLRPIRTAAAAIQIRDAAFEDQCPKVILSESVVVCRRCSLCC